MGVRKGQGVEDCSIPACWLERAAEYARSFDSPAADTVFGIFESLSSIASWKKLGQFSSDIISGIFRYEVVKDYTIPFRSQLTSSIKRVVERTGRDNPCLFTVRNAVRSFFSNNPEIVRSLRPIVPGFWGNGDLIYIDGHSPDLNYQTVDADTMNAIIERYRKNGLPVIALVNRFKDKKFIGRHYVAIGPQADPFDDGQRLPYMDPGVGAEKNGRSTLVFDEARRTWVRLPIEPPPGRPYRYRYEMIGLLPYSSSATDDIREIGSRKSKGKDETS